MSEQITPEAKFNSTRRVSVKRHSIGLGARNSIFFNQTIDQQPSLFISNSVRVEFFLSQKFTAWVLSSLIVIYSLLVVVRIAFDSEISSADTQLDILELVFLSIFVIEIALRIFAYKLVKLN